MSQELAELHGHVGETLRTVLRLSLRLCISFDTFRGLTLTWLEGSTKTF